MKLVYTLNAISQVPLNYRPIKNMGGWKGKRRRFESKVPLMISTVSSFGVVSTQLKTLRYLSKEFSLQVIRTT